MAAPKQTRTKVIERVTAHSNLRDSREAIIAAAAELFLAHGFGGTSMDLIARDAGVARRTLYNQFDSKEVLFGATIERLWTTFDINLVNDADSRRDPKVGLTKLARAVAEFWAESPVAVRLVRMMIAESKTFVDLPQRFYDAGKGPSYDILVAYLKDMEAAGHLRVSDLQLAARQIIGMLNEPLLWPRIYGYESAPPSRAYVRKVIAETVDTFMARYGV